MGYAQGSSSVPSFIRKVHLGKTYEESYIELDDGSFLDRIKGIVVRTSHDMPERTLVLEIDIEGVEVSSVHGRGY